MQIKHLSLSEVQAKSLLAGEHILTNFRSEGEVQDFLLAKMDLNKVELGQSDDKENEIAQEDEASSFLDNPSNQR